MSQSTLSISRPLSSARHSSNYAKLEEELTLTWQDNQELKNKCKRLEHSVDCLVWNIIKQLQTQVQGKESWKGNHAKRANIEARVLMSEEGHLELVQLCEQVCLKEQQQAKDTAQKAAGDQEQHKWQTDITIVFTGPLNKSRQKNELEDIAAALALLESGKKDKLLQCICNHFNEHLDLKTSPCFKGLFHSHKCAHIANNPTPGPSTICELTVPSSSNPTLPLNTLPPPLSLPPNSTLMTTTLHQFEAYQFSHYLA